MAMVIIRLAMIRGENFYKNGIYENVNAFLKRIEKGTDTLIQDDIDRKVGKDKEETEETECE